MASTEMADKPSSIKFELKFPPGYEPKYASGAIGTVTLRGELIIHFFVESPEFQTLESYAVLPDGRVGSRTDPQTTQAVFERRVGNGVVLSRQGALDLYGWLGDRVREIELQDVARLQAQAATQGKH
jgi:hypothetical protein